MTSPTSNSRRPRLAGWLAAGSAAFVAAQGYYAGHRSLPHFEDLDASVTSPDPDALRIVTLGDSTMTGPGLGDPSDIWFHQALAIIGSPPYTLAAFAKGGAKTRDVVTDQLGPAAAFGAQLALVSIGSNDAIRGVPVATMRRYFEAIIDGLPGALIVVLGVGDMSTIPRLPQPLATFAQVRARSAGRMQRTVAASRERVLSVPMFELAGPIFRSTPGLFLPDLFHPNAAGHRVWANAAAPTLRRAIRHVTEERTQ